MSKTVKNALLGVLLFLGSFFIFSGHSVSAATFANQVDISAYDGHPILISVQGGTIDRVNVHDGSGYKKVSGTYITDNHFIL